VKIVHVIETLALASGGPAVGTASFAAAESLLGHDVSIICYDDPELAAAIHVFGQYPGFDRVVVRVIPRGGWLEKKCAFNALSIFRKLFTPESFVISQGVWRPMLARALFVAREKKLSYAIVPHGMLDTWSLKQKPWRKRLAWWLAWKTYCNNALLIRVLNADEQRLIEPLHITACMEQSPNGIFPEEYASLPAAGEFFSNNPHLKNRRFVLFLSRLHFKKGLDYLIEAFAIAAKEIDDVILVIAGPDGGAQAQLLRDIKRLHLTERVHIVGPLYGRDKLSALVDAYCFCLPSRQEGFSIAITEALAAGTPVVISENCNFPEVTEAHAGHVVKLDNSHVASALIDLLRSQTKRDAAGRAGKAMIFERFTWQAITTKWCTRIQLLTTKTHHQTSTPG
jgi:glycosyltransferase involved in cell wall biosynthesis